MQYSKWVSVAVLLLLISSLTQAQQLSLGNTPYMLNKSAVLELNSTNQGLLLPRVADTTGINTLNPPDGMVIYFVPTKQFLLRAYGYWNPLAAAASLTAYWSTTGNANGAIKKFGTTDNYALPFVTNNTERMRLTATGYLGIGNSNPTSLLHITGTNPLTLNGVQVGGTTSSDSLLTINNGTVQKLPAATFQPTLNGTGFVKSSGGTISYDNNTYTVANTPITGTTRTKITYDAKGLVTAGTTLSAGDIPDLSATYQPLNGSLTSISGLAGTTGYLKKTAANTYVLDNSSFLTSETDPVVKAINGIVKSNGTTISAAAAGTDYVAPNAAITGATKTKITYDAKGLVTAGADATTSDIAEGSNLYYTDARVRATALTGLSTATATSVTATDNVVSGVGKLQAQINSINSAGYLTGNQTITLSGDVSGSGTTAITTSIGANKVTLNHLAQVNTGTFLGRTTTGTGNVEALTTAQAKTLLGLTGSNSGDVTLSGQNYLSLSGQTITANAVDLSGTHATGTLAATRFGALTGDVTNTAGSYATTIANGAVTYGKMQNISATSRLLGRYSTGAGSPEEILIGAGLSLSGNTLSAAAATTAWNINGNTGLTASHFLGTTDDKALILKSNNNSYAEFGRRNTLGLVQNYTDYTDSSEQVLHLKSALQFNAPSALFYKPKMYVNAAGNLRMKGSSAGTDFFELGSVGTNNDGGFEFIVGDDGDEPIVFKSNHFQNGTVEMMRLQSGRMALGSNAFNATNPEKLLIDAGTTTSYNLMTGKGSIDNYLQINVQNRSATANASSDLVATADNGDETSNFIDMGINSSAYSNATYPVIGGINNTYLYGTGNDFVIGNATANKPLRFFTGGYALTNERLRIDGTGKIGIGNTAPTEILDVTGNLKFSGALLPGGAAGTAGYVLTSAGAGAAPTWQDGTSYVTSSAWLQGGNTLSVIKNFGTTSNHALPFITNNVERMRLSTNGFLGLGTSAPAGRLHLVSDNSETGNDYLFDDYSNAATPGLFMRKARGTVASPLNLQSGDVIGALSFVPHFNGSLSYVPGSGIDAYYVGNGTTNKTNLRFLTSATEHMRINEDGNVGIGATTFDAVSPEKLLVDAGTSTYTPILAQGAVNSYFQINIKNAGTGNQSSSDLVATANNGTETTNFVNLGINGSNYVYQTGNPIETGKFNDGYLISSGNDLYIVNNNATKDVIFLAGGTAPANEAMRITAAEKIGIGTTAPNSTLSLNGSMSMKYRSGTGAYTIADNDYVVINTGTATTWTLPAASTCAGRVYRLVNHGSGTVTLSPSIILANGVNSTSLSSASGSNVMDILSDGTSWRRIN